MAVFWMKILPSRRISWQAVSSPSPPVSFTREDLTVCYHIKDPILILPPDPPIIPPRRSSFCHTATANARPVLLDDIASSTDSIEANNRRRGYNATSNTWTSSSGEISETDDVDSRATFVEEYNKIANQVCLF